MKKIGCYMAVFLLAAAMAFIWACGDSGGGGPTCVAGKSCDDVSGTWETTEHVSASACDDARTDYGVYTVSQDLSKCTIVFTVDEVNGVNPGVGSFPGTVDGNKVCVTGGFTEDGGTTTTTVNVTVSSDIVTGSATWSWKGQGRSCSGTTQISGTRTSP